jgi:uncharacterized caspase-like protein
MIFGAMRRLLVALLLLSGLPVAAQETRCGAGKDLIVQALERISPQSDQNAFEDALQLLKHAVSECGELGDAWYYRSLVEQKLGHDQLAHYTMDKASFLGSEALRQGLNPLVLATPSSRGIAVEANPERPTQPSPVQAGPVQQKWALVIGISRFTDGKVPPLRYTTADANAFAAELEDPMIGRFPAPHVHVLTDQQATTRNIKEALNWIARRAKPNDLVVIYVATHGTPRTLDSAGGANYLVTYDTAISNAGQFDEDAMYATAYPMVELADAVATRMRALRTAVILDTCYSGGSVNALNALQGALPDKPPSAEMLARMSQGTGRIVLTASQANEESLESGELQHGYFTYYLLEALKSGKGVTPLSQVFATVAQRVSQRVAAGGMRQHPVMSRSSEDADFALGVLAAEPPDSQP